jgi:hypothetical protein
MFCLLILLKTYGEVLKNIKMLILKLSRWYSLLLCSVHVGPVYASQSGVESFSWLPIIICLLFTWCSISVVLGLCILAWWFWNLVVLCASICVCWLQLCRDVDDLHPTVCNSLCCGWSCCPWDMLYILLWCITTIAIR